MNYDITRLRKERGMSQSELARLLQVTQSFLSAIENGKSPLPPEKEERIREIFNLENLGEYALDSDPAAARIAGMTDSDLFNQLLQRFHQQAHKHEEAHHHHDHHARIQELEAEIARLTSRNEELQDLISRLFDRNEKLMERNDYLFNQLKQQKGD